MFWPYSYFERVLKGLQFVSRSKRRWLLAYGFLSIFASVNRSGYLIEEGICSSRSKFYRIDNFERILLPRMKQEVTKIVHLCVFATQL